MRPWKVGLAVGLLAGRAYASPMTWSRRIAGLTTSNTVDTSIATDPATLNRHTHEKRGSELYVAASRIFNLLEGGIFRAGSVLLSESYRNKIRSIAQGMIGTQTFNNAEEYRIALRKQTNEKPGWLLDNLQRIRSEASYYHCDLLIALREHLENVDGAGANGVVKLLTDDDTRAKARRRRAEAEIISRVDALEAEERRLRKNPRSGLDKVEAFLIQGRDTINLLNDHVNILSLPSASGQEMMVVFFMEWKMALGFSGFFITPGEILHARLLSVVCLTSDYLSISEDLLHQPDFDRMHLRNKEEEDLLVAVKKDLKLAVALVDDLAHLFGQKSNEQPKEEDSKNGLKGEDEEDNKTHLLADYGSNSKLK